MAERDRFEAAGFYRQQDVARLASRFLDEFVRVVRLLIEFPEIGAPVDELRRVHSL